MYDRLNISPFPTLLSSTSNAMLNSRTTVSFGIKFCGPVNGLKLLVVSTFHLSKCVLCSRDRLKVSV